MKALDILTILLNDDWCPNCGIWENDGTLNLREQFGAVNHKGKELRKGKYFYLYAEDYGEFFPSIGPADLLVETDDAGNVWLWEMEN